MTTQTAAALEHFEPHADPDAMLDALQRDAAIVIDRLVQPADLCALRAEIDPHLEATPYGEIDFHGNHTRRIGALIARSTSCGRLATHPLLLALANGFLGPYCDEIQLHFTQAVRIDPGETAQMLHRDRGVWGGYLTRKIETPHVAAIAGIDNRLGREIEG